MAITEWASEWSEFEGVDTEDSLKFGFWYRRGDAKTQGRTLSLTPIEILDQIVKIFDVGILGRDLFF